MPKQDVCPLAWKSSRNIDRAPTKLNIVFSLLAGICWLFSRNLSLPGIGHWQRGCRVYLNQASWVGEEIRKTQGWYLEAWSNFLLIGSSLCSLFKSFKLYCPLGMFLFIQRCCFRTFAPFRTPSMWKEDFVFKALNWQETCIHSFISCTLTSGFCYRSGHEDTYLLLSKGKPVWRLREGHGVCRWSIYPLP